MKLALKNGINDPCTATSQKIDISWIWHVFQNIEMCLPEVWDWTFCQQTAQWTHKSKKIIPQSPHRSNSEDRPRIRKVVQKGMLYMVWAQQAKNTILF